MNTEAYYTIEGSIAPDRSDDLEPCIANLADSFDSLYNQIVRRLGTDSGFDVRLILEVMKSAARAKDGEAYFLGDTFKYHCYLLGLDHEYLLEAIVSKGLARTAALTSAGRAKQNAVAIRAKYKSGNYSRQDLSIEYSVSTDHIADIVRGIKRPDTRSDTFEADVLHDRQVLGHSIKDIAAKHKAGQSSVRRILKAHGLNKAIPKKKRYHLDN